MESTPPRRRLPSPRACWLLAVGLWPAGLAHAADEPASAAAGAEALDHVVVEGRRRMLVGESMSASEGVVGNAEIERRPLTRPGDLLEFVPGLVATSHSGSGKANQYFLRGFNLDHGTDFATWVDGMPVNLRTHAHGQGYTDLSFVIPETVATIRYRKGNYYADVGDFGSAGSAELEIATTAPGVAELTLGEYGYRRALLMDTVHAGDGHLLYAAEAQTDSGPWTDVDEDVHKGNALLRFSRPWAGGDVHVQAMGYRNRWNSADQIPTRAVAAGLISEYGSLDPTAGGETSRASLSAGWAGALGGGEFRADAYSIDYRLDLWSNFTYLLDDPEQGDQFQQVDRRRIHGGRASQTWKTGGTMWRIGAEARVDDIARVALLRTLRRAPVGSVRDDAVDERSAGAFIDVQHAFGAGVRGYAGLRHDRYDFDVHSSLPANSGRADASRTSWKSGLAWRPRPALELYAGYGTGFHSNDARGTTITVDPLSGEPAARVDALVGSRGYELGARFQPAPAFQATLAAWSLRLDSELLFVGDAGTTDVSRPSRRDGLEIGLYWAPDAVWTAHLEASATRARFDDGDAADDIPGAVPLVVGAGLAARWEGGWNASLQLRHLGGYPLVEDGAVESEGSTRLDLRAGREFARWGLHVDVLNLLDRRDHDIDYFYASRLPGEPEEGVEDIHYHIFAPRSVRLTAQYRF